MSDYTFPAVVNTVKLGSKKVKNEGDDEAEDVPHLTLTLT